MRAPLAAVAALVAFGGCVLNESARGPRVRYADEFDLSSASCGLGRKVLPCRAVDGGPLVKCGKTYAHGFGTRPESAVVFAANGKVTALDAIVCIDDGARKDKPSANPAASFFVWADGRIVWSVKDVLIGQKPIPVHVDLTGAKEIVLETRSARHWTDFMTAHGDWLQARFTCGAGASLDVTDDPALFEQLGILTPPEKPEPQFNGADIWGVRPGHPVIFRVPVSGVRPMKFTATGLPAGVTLDSAKGILGGVAPAQAGDYDITVTAENAKGRASRVIRLAVGEKIALTPPMGWNSWNIWAHLLTAESAKSAADAMDRFGLANYGWAYVNLDDWWEMNNSGSKSVEARRKALGHEDVIGPARDAEGRILANRSFPDMKGLCDYVHGLGLKIGLYSSPGPTTCGGCEGTYGHERADAARYAEWGFDYLKYDGCSYVKPYFHDRGYKLSDRDRRAQRDGLPMEHPETFPPDELWREPYRIMGEALAQQPRDILFSIGQGGQGGVEKWGRGVGGNCWRTWDDLKDTWNWMELALDSIQGDFHRHNRPGWWADPDMMLVGDQYSFGSRHPTCLTPNEQYTHVSLWAMIGSPMLLGCDLAKLDAFTRSLLVNPGVVAISQDRLGKTAQRLRHVDGESVWARPLADGATAVALVNRSPIAREISVSFVELGLGYGLHWVKDVWRQQCEGRHADRYVAVVPPHATKLIYIRPVSCPKCD